MTKARAPLTAQNALLTIAGTIGWAAVAEICRRGERAARNWSDPDTSAQISFGAAVSLDAAYLAAGGEVPPFAQVHQLQLDLSTAMRAANFAAKAARAAEAVRETGEALGAQIIALNPQATPGQRAIAVEQTEEAITALTATLSDLSHPALTAPQE